MKTIKHIHVALAMALTATGALSLSSCSDMLDCEPQGQFTASQLNDESIEGLMAASYAALQSHFFGNNEAFAGPITNWIFDVRSDDALKGGGGISMENNIHLLEVSNIQSDNASVFNKWQNNYYGVSRCNKAIEAINNAEVNDKDNLLAQLRTLRAYFYFDLMRCFDKIVYFTEGQVASEVPIDEYTREQIWDFIKADLADAYKKLPESQSEPGKFNRYVAAALMTKVAAQTSDWNLVREYSGYVINSGKYQLYPNFLDMSKVEFNNQYEAILSIQFSTANNNANINWCNLLNTTYSEGNLFGNGDDFFLASQNLVNAYKTDTDGLPYLNGGAPTADVTTNYAGNVDPRVDFTVGRIGMPFRGHTYNIHWCRAYDVYGEYSGKKGLISPESPLMVQGFPWGASPLNFSLIRYADILLLRAEADVELNQDLAEARNLVNQIRAKAARSVTPDYTPVDCDPNIASYAVGQYPEQGWTQEYARRAVRTERRLELAMEGQRWFDLLRWGNAVETMNAYYNSESKIHPYLAGAKTTDSDLYFPLPLTEVENAGGLYGSFE